MARSALASSLSVPGFVLPHSSTMRQVRMGIQIIEPGIFRAAKISHHRGTQRYAEEHTARKRPLRPSASLCGEKGVSRALAKRQPAAVDSLHGGEDTSP